MSWSFSATGRPERVIERLEEYADSLGAGPSRDELEAARPHIAGLVRQIFEHRGEPYATALVKVEAYGSGSRDSSGEAARTLRVLIEPIHATL